MKNTPIVITTRTQIINDLIRRYKYRSYLEIGVRDTRKNFDKIIASKKTGVDPSPLFVSERSKKQIKHITSDEFFFTNISSKPLLYDIIFIDGLHTEHQVTKDIQNSLMRLKTNGTIVVHDCNPPSEWHQREEQGEEGGDWNGTVWKGFMNFRHRNDLIMNVIDTDWGVGIIRRAPKGVFSSPLMIFANEMTYQNLNENRKEWLNLLPSYPEFLETLRK